MSDAAMSTQRGRDRSGPRASSERERYASLADGVRDRIETVRAVVAEDFTGVEAAHDLGHLDRVARLAALIADEEGADPEVAGVAAYVHDYHRLVEQRARTGQSSDDTAALIEAALNRAGVDEAVRPAVRAAVDATGRFSFSDRYRAPEQLVAACLHDADMLDAMGAVGVARAFLFGGALGEPMWVAGEALQDTYRSGRTSSVVAHFYEKLIHLRGELHTAAADRLAEERHAFLEAFLERFHLEWGDAGTADDPRTGQPMSGRQP